MVTIAFFFSKTNMLEGLALNGYPRYEVVNTFEFSAYAGPWSELLPEENIDVDKNWVDEVMLNHAERRMNKSGWLKQNHWEEYLKLKEYLGEYWKKYGKDALIHIEEWK